MSTEMVRPPEQTSNVLSIRPANTLELAIRNTLPFPKTSLPTATEAVTRIIGCYPNGKPSDSETYISALVAVLAGYPPEIVARVSDPVRGVVSKSKFLPTVAELTDACEADMAPLRRRWREIKEQRESEEKRRLVVTDEGAKKRVAESMEKLSVELSAAPDPVPPKRDGTAPVGTSAGGAVAKVIAEIAAKKATDLEGVGNG
jgi:hypothetical protein